MIDIIFTYFNETILVRINGYKVLFGNNLYGAKMAEIDGLKLSQSGVIKEFPDLKDDKDWRKKAIERFKWKIKDMSCEEEIYEYLVNDLKKYGYIPRIKQRVGFRPERIK